MTATRRRRPDAALGGRRLAAAAGRMPTAGCELARHRRTRPSEADRKQHANDLGRELGRRLGTGSGGQRGDGGALGDFFQYMIDHPVTLARQKTAMLPIVGKDVEGRRSPSTTSASRPSTRSWA